MNTRMRGPNAGHGQPVIPMVRALVEQTFRHADVPAVRRVAAAFGARAGMSMAKLSDFVQAVSEAAACAVAQGPCTAKLRLWTMENRAFCEVCGDGTLLADGPKGPVQGEAERLRRWLLQRARILPAWRAQMLMYDRYHRYVMRAEREMYQAPELKAVICNAEMIKREIVEDFDIDANKIHVIYNSIDSSRFVPAQEAQRAILRQQFGLPADAVVFCFVGSGFERKGLASAIRAIAGTSAWLIVVGQDKAESRYRDLARSLGCEGQIRFLGVQKETLPFYQLSDGLLLPTLYDPFPNVILEAMACGLPVITSESCGGAEFIQQGQNGFFCDALDISTLKEAVAAIPSLEKNNNMGRAARERVKDATPEKLSSQLITLYQKLLD